MEETNFITDRKSKVFLIIGIVLIIFFLFIAVLLFARIYLGEPLVREYGNVGIVELKEVILDSKRIIEELEEFRTNPDVRAIIVRVDSPGGAVGPSQEIYEEIKRIKKEKKVIASLGNIAASGGYYAIAAADRIIANPSTITGSIGVILQFINFKDLAAWAKLRPITLKSGKYKDAMSGLRDLTSEEHALVMNVLADIHTQFIEDVAAGRGLETEVIKKLAVGRVFTGREAIKLKLVDELGGIEFAKDSAKEIAGLDEEVKALYPKKSKMDILNFLLEEDDGAKFENFLQTHSLRKLGLLLSPIQESLFNLERNIDIR
jgi:protease-4